MRTWTEPRPGSRWPLGLLGMLAIMILVESSLKGFRLDLTSPATLTWSLSEHAARTEARECDVLCFGESLVKHGLLPGVIEKHREGRAYNLSVCAAQAPTSYYLLKRALESGARPSSVVVDFAPDLLAGGPEYNERNWPELLTWTESLDLALSARNTDLFLALTLGKLLPSVRTRHEIADLLMGQLQNRDASPRSTNRLYVRQWAVNRGGQFTPPNPLFTGEVTEAEHTAMMSDHFWCNSINRKYVHRFLDLAGSSGARVYWLLPPLPEAVQARRDASGADARLEAFLRGIQARHPGLVVLDARHSGYGTSVFQDARHLVADGTLALSEDVAQAIEGTGSERWIRLPPFHSPSIDPGLEDVNASRMALENETGSVRK